MIRTGKKIMKQDDLSQIEQLRILSESGVTIPPSDNIMILSAICGLGNNKIFWRSLVNIETDPCRDESLIAMMDFSQKIVN